MIDLASFDGGLMGIAARRDIGQYKVWMGFSSSLIILGILVHSQYLHHISDQSEKYRGN
jgi:hypothetical protein